MTRDGESASEHRARDQVFEVVEELFEIARTRVPDAIKRVSQENSNATNLQDFRQKEAS